MDGLLLIVAQVDRHELTRVLVQAPDVEGVVVDHVFEPAGDLAEHRAQIQRPQQHGAYVEQPVAQGELALELF